MPGPPGWVQKQQQALEAAERRKQLLASMPPAHKHAFELLTSRQIDVHAIVRVEPDSVLFLGPAGPRTAWLLSSKAGGVLSVCVEDGFPCDPGPNVLAAFGE
jgi:hypothetical protein